MQSRINKIIERFFVQEPALFTVICSHEIVENDKVRCPVRSGCGRIEYNPAFVKEMTDTALEEALKTEAIRILLKHPYERRPDGCCGAAIAVGSNLAIADNYRFARFYMKMPDDYGLKRGQAYEVYSRQLQDHCVDDPLMEGDANTDLSELWEEDALQVAMINNMIDSIKDWGSLSGDMAEMIRASAKASIDWRKVLAGFRAQVLTMDRRLTRMRPSRRTGFDNMGSLRKFTSKLLVAVDVSGSISSESISYFLGVINSAFKYGLTAIDVIQFEVGITACQTLTQALKSTFVLGRGGTNFQAPIDFAAEYDYDGLVILTDGFAPEPVIPPGFHTHILWVCEDEDCYEAHCEWMTKTGRVCTMKLG